MAQRPELVDNEETTHAAALAWLVSDLGVQHPLSVATGYVNLSGLHHLAELISAGYGARLLLGAAPEPGLGAEVPLGRFELALETLRRERDLSRFPPSRSASRLATVETWLGSESVEVRRFVDQFLHGKAYLFGTQQDARAALVTSANLTGGGLFSNRELGLVNYQPGTARSALIWFDKLWENASDFKDELRALLFPDPGLVDPQTVYLRALLELYGDELEMELPPSRVSAVALAPFQRDGYERARRILALHHGVVYADGVGTGKTEIGLAFIEEYALRLGQHALVVTPAQLRGNWEERIDQARLPAQVVSFQQLARDEQLAPDRPDHERVLHNSRDSYRLVVVDEAHAFRTPGTTWYRAMSRLLGGERKDVVLLTATPVNNGLWDLYHLVMLFARHDRALASRGIPSIREVFVRAGANERDPENLDPELLFPVVDSVSVRRDRRFIEANYPRATFPDGTPVRFPRPVPSTRRYDLEGAHPELFDEITGRIGELTMARYRPSAYEVVGGPTRAEEATLAGLMQSQLLKRFESCWASCLESVRRMVVAHDVFLASWDHGVVPSKEVLRNAARQEFDDAGVATWVEETLAADVDGRPIEEFKDSYRHDVEADRVLLVCMQERLQTLDAASDSKFALLCEVLASLSAQKVAVFATYADTVRYLDDHLPRPAYGRERVVVIGTESDPDARAAALARFCPETVVRPGYVPPDGEVDMLVSTDVLSEGQNLQQAGAVVSYDMPWNPQRVVQRNGRVIRLRSPHESVELVTMLPVPGELERLLGLEATIRRKILAASVFGMETEVLDDVDVELRSYAERLEAGDETLFDPLPEEGAAFAGEELRAALRRALAEGEIARLKSLPWGVGAAFAQGPDVPSVGPVGWFFACRTRADERYWRYVEAQDKVEGAEGVILGCINPGNAPRADPTSVPLGLEEAWQAAVESIVAEQRERADPRRATESVGPLQRFALDVLRDPAVRVPVGGSLAAEALSVERSSSVRQALADIRRAVDATEISREEAARQIVAVVESFGLQPVEPVPVAEPIAEDDVGVVCWMAVLADALGG